MVINLLDKSLEQLKEHRKRFSLKLTLQIGFQLLKLLKSIHNKGLVHRDIKPDNFLFGLNDNVNKLFIIDFGLCKTYLNGDNKHIQIKSTSSLIGTPTFASINAHNCLELSRRDDLESLGYMLIYFVNIYLSWQYIIENNQIMEYKQNITRYDYVPSIIIKYMDYIKSLTFEEAPNYSYLTNMLSSEI
jgi:serine/threonine protein kinase